MNWEIKKDGNLLTVAIVGRFVAAVAPDLREEVGAKISDGTNVLFDLGKMVHIDSSGLGVLVQVLQKVKAGGGKVILAALQPAPKIVFDITKVSRALQVNRKWHEASCLLHSVRQRKKRHLGVRSGGRAGALPPGARADASLRASGSRRS